MSSYVYNTTYDPAAKIWSGRQPGPIFHPNANIAEVLFDTLRHNPDKIGQISDNDGRRMTNGEIRLNSIRVAQHLHQLGIRKGDVVAVAASNHANISAVMFGALALGATTNPLDPNFKTVEISHFLALTQPKIIFCEVANFQYVRESMQNLDLAIPIYTFEKIPDATDKAKYVNELLLETGHEEDFVPTRLTDGRSEAAVIVCSTGSAGIPKGVSLSHAHLLDQCCTICDIKSDDTIFSFSALHWVSGLINLLAGTLQSATRIITPQPFTPVLMLRLVSQYQVTWASGSSISLSRLLECPSIETTDLSSLKRFYVGGMPVPELLRQRMNRFLPNGNVIILYGLSEVAGVLTTNESDNHPSSVGQLGCGMRCRILSKTGELCGPNENGEISIWLEPPFLGYFNDAAATNAFKDADGWLQTGDVGRFDNDGYLYFVDRMKDIIMYYGGVSPTEIEAVVLGVRGVAAVCVVGIQIDVINEWPIALVVRNGREDVTEQEICDHVKEQLSDLKMLRGGVFFVDKLPITPSLKVLKREAVMMATALYNERHALD